MHQETYRQERLQEIRDPSGKSTGYKYNAKGLLSIQTHPDGSYRRYSYNSNNLVNGIEREDKTELLFSYDYRQNIIALIARKPKANSTRWRSQLNEEKKKRG